MRDNKPILSDGTKISGSCALAGALHTESPRGTDALDCIHVEAQTADKKDEPRHLLGWRGCITTAHVVLVLQNRLLR